MRMAALLSIILAAGCTTLGADDARARRQIDYGPPVNIRLCVLRDQTLGNDQAISLLNAISAEMKPFGIVLEVPWIKPWERQGHVHNVVFPTGTAQFKDRLYIYYGAADSYVACASIRLPQLLKEILKYKKGYTYTLHRKINN